MKKPWSLVLLFTFCAFALSGCAEMKANYISQTCNQEGGYEKGMNDARSGQPMSQSFADWCEGPAHDIAVQAYHNGYTAGLQILAQTPQPTVINVNNSEGPPVSSGPWTGPPLGGPPMGEPREWACQIVAHNSAFEGWGHSQADARDRAFSKCARAYQEMQCREVHCRRNE